MEEEELEFMLVDCKECGAIVNAEVVGGYIDTDNVTAETYRISLLRCPRCGGPALVSEIAFNDGFDQPVRLYPPRETGIGPAIPKSIRSAYEEARTCFNAKAYTATAIMCRKILEGIAEEHSITARNLATSLKDLRDKGIIESRLFEWADALRISGNEAAHGVSTSISAQDAKDILEFTNALLEYVFTFQDKFRAFQKRRNDKESSVDAQKSEGPKQDSETQ